MDPSKHPNQRGIKKNAESQIFGVKKKTLKAGKDTGNGGGNFMSKLEAMKKFSKSLPRANGSIAASSNDVNSKPSTVSVENKNKNKYAEEVLKEAIKKRINDKFQLSKAPPKIIIKSKQNEAIVPPATKKVGNSDLTESQLQSLMKKFNLKNYISLGERATLAKELGLTEYQVQVWFSNRRTKLKKTQELSGPQPPKTVVQPQAVPPSKRAKSKGIKYPDALPKMKPLQVDALLKMTEIEEKMKNPEVIDILDDEDDLSGPANFSPGTAVDDVPCTTKQGNVQSKEPILEGRKRLESLKEEIGKRNLQVEMGQEKLFLDQKGDKMLEDQKDKEIDILKQEIKIILNDMVKKSVMEKEVEALKTKYESAMKAYKEKEQVVKNLEVKIPNMIEEFTKCVENKEYLFDLKEKELKKSEATIIEKENQLKNCQTEVTQLNNALEKWKVDKNDFVLKVASLDVKASKLSNEVFKKDMEMKKIKEKEKENTYKLKQLSRDLEQKKEETVAQNLNNSELSILTAKLENQTNSTANLTKTCDYQKSQISYLRREVETKVEVINKKETELKQIKENVKNLADIQTNVNQLMVKSENQARIIENQKAIISKYKVQTEEQAKQISKLAELQEKLNDNNVEKNTLKQTLEKKSGQVKKMKKNIEVKNDEMSKFKSAQDQLFSQINDLELKNFNKTEELMKVESKLKSVEKKRMKTVNIYEATMEYMKIMKENHKGTKASAKKNVPIITLDEQTCVETPAEKSENSTRVSGSSGVIELNGSVQTQAETKADINEQAFPVPYASQHAISSKENKSENWPGVATSSEKHVGKVSSPLNHKPVPMITYLWPLVTTETETNSSHSSIEMNSSACSLTKLHTSKSSVGKRTRKLVKRPDIDMSEVTKKNRYFNKRKLLLTDSGIPTKRKKMFSRIYSCYDRKNLHQIFQTFSLPPSVSLSNWEKLMTMKIKLNSSTFSKPDHLLQHQPYSLHPSPHTLAIGYNWPIIPYTEVTLTINRSVAELPKLIHLSAHPEVKRCEEPDASWPIVPYSKPSDPSWPSTQIVDQKVYLVLQNFDLLFPARSLTASLLPQWPVHTPQKCQFGEKRKSSNICGGKSKRFKIDSPAWPLTLFEHSSALEDSLTRIPPTIRRIDLLFPRERLSDSQFMLLTKKRSRNFDKSENIPSKKFKLSVSPTSLDSSVKQSSTCWPVALIQPTPMFIKSSSEANVCPQVPQFPSVIRHIDPQPCDDLPVIQVTEIKLLFAPSPLLSLRLEPERTCWPLVPYKTVRVEPPALKIQMRTLPSSETVSKKRKICDETTSFLTSNHEFCKQLVLSLLEEVPVLTSNHDLCEQLVLGLLEEVPASIRFGCTQDQP
eukprot:GFUD01035584.1.p1 GENE.GFUD01035584.1~~GFUD01035584.1.p1  ORF type:complete len:1354 (+),score=385.07 GFUD01035584.1:29-4090(+)